MKKNKQLGCILAFALGSITSANATVDLFNNLDFPNFNGGSGLPTGWVANQFSTGSACPDGCTLGDITLFISLDDTDGDDSSPTTDYTLEVTTDNGTSIPGPITIATMTNPGLFNAGQEEYVFTSPQAATPLQANTDYWVVLTATDPGAAGIEWLYDFSPDGSGKWAISDGSAGTGTLQMMRVEAIQTIPDVPLPAAFWLMTSALGGLAVTRSRAKRVA